MQEICIAKVKVTKVALKIGTAFCHVIQCLFPNLFAAIAIIQCNAMELPISKQCAAVEVCKMPFCGHWIGEIIHGEINQIQVWESSEKF